MRTAATVSSGLDWAVAFKTSWQLRLPKKDLILLLAALSVENLSPSDTIGLLALKEVQHILEPLVTVSLSLNLGVSPGAHVELALHIGFLDFQQLIF